MTPVITLEENELIARRDELLSELNLASYEAFRQQARSGLLSDRGWGVRDELDSIAYLLGEDELTD